LLKGQARVERQACQFLAAKAIAEPITATESNDTDASFPILFERMIHLLLKSANLLRRLSTFFGRGSIKRQFDATISCPAFQRVVGIDRIGLQ